MTDVAVRNPQQELVSRVRSEEFKQQVALALPPNVTPDRFARATVTALLQNPDIANAEPDSIFQSLLRCAQDGLLPDGREAALVIFNTKVKVNGHDQWVKKAQYLPMIGGFRKIAAEHGWALRTAVVHEHDEFVYELGLEPHVGHIPVRPGRERGEMVAAYAVAAHKDGRRELEVMYADEIQKARSVSRAKDSGPWVDWTERMWEKTVGRRLFAKLPLAERDEERVRIERVLGADDPATAYRLMYGRPAAAARSELPPPREVPARHPLEPDTSTSAALADGGDQQADASPRDHGTGEASAPGPGGEIDFSDEPREGFEPPAGALDQQDEERIASARTAGETLVPSGDNKGLTLAQVAEKGGHGEAWLLWALKRWSADRFRAAVELYVETFVPDVWERYQQFLESEQAA